MKCHSHPTQGHVGSFPLLPGTVVNAGEPEECALTFYMFGNQRNRVVFTGLTAEEGARSDSTTTGHRLTCACTTVEGLTPLQWLDKNQTLLPEDDRKELVDYKVASGQEGSAVNLRINKNGFSCTEAGVYTCVVGTNNRTVLVTPIGEYSKQCRLRGLSCSTRSNASLCWWGAYLHSTPVMHGDSACNVAVPASQVRSVVLPMLPLQPAPLVQLALGQTSPCSAQQKTKLGQVSRTSGSRMAP